MFFVLFPQQSFLSDASHSVQSSVLVVEMNCPLQSITEFSTHGNRFATESVHEKCKQTVDVLVVETECIQFRSNPLMSAISI